MFFLSLCMAKVFLDIKIYLYMEREFDRGFLLSPLSHLYIYFIYLACWLT